MTAPQAFQWTHPVTWPRSIYLWLAWIVIILAVQWRKPVQRRIDQVRASEWPIAPGRIEFVYVRSKGLRRRRSSFVAELDYSYTAEGQNFTGRYDRDFYLEPEARNFIRDLQEKPVSVSYNPRNPAKSALRSDAVTNLLRSKSPYSEQALTTPLVLEPPSWSKPLLWPLIVLSLMGLMLSLWVHIGALAGKKVAPNFLFWMLHIGIFVVWFPAVLMAKERIGNMQRRDFWKAILSGAPDWVRYMLYGFFGYAVINFGLFMLKAPADGGHGSPPTEVWRGFSGHWMAFYSAAFAIFYSAVLSTRPTSESNRT